jgi:hypothetical protein
MKGHLAAQPLSSTLLAPDQSDRMAGTGRKQNDSFGEAGVPNRTFTFVWPGGGIRAKGDGSARGRALEAR